MKEKKEKVFPSRGYCMILYKELESGIDEEKMRYEFTDNGSVDKLLRSDIFELIREKCEAYFLDYYEEQLLSVDQITVALEIINSNINKRKHDSYRHYLLKIVEFMNIAINNGWCLEFIF